MLPTILKRLGGLTRCIDVTMEVRLRVAEARSRDVGRKIARISRDSMAKLGVEVGDFIEIEGPKGIAVAQVWPLHPDEDPNLIRIDGFIREAIGASIGDTVRVRRAANVQPATRVVLAPTEPMRFSRDFVEYVKDYLLRKPLARGEVIIIPFFGAAVRLVVVSTQPEEYVYVTDQTSVEIEEEAPAEVSASTYVSAPVSSMLVDCDSLSFARLHPSRDILESIVATVLSKLGFHVVTDARRPNRSGGLTEVDVWATKGDFRVYVSCKNWNKDVGRPVVEEEFGRVQNLRELPHLKLLVVKSMTSEAKRTAIANGFYVIELGKKAEESNAAEICKLVLHKLLDLFVSIAPRQLSEAYKKLEEINRLIEDLAMRINELQRLLATR